MATIPIVEVHIERIQRDVTIISYRQDPELGLSIPAGDFVTSSWGSFAVDGYAQVARALVQYRILRPTTSQFQTLSKQEMCEFFKGRISFLISEREADLWWIDLMKPVGDGSMVVPIGPERQREFQPSRMSGEFVRVIQSFVVSSIG